MNEINIRYADKNDIPFIVECQLMMAAETENLQLNHHTVTMGVEAVFNDPLKGFYIIGQTGPSDNDSTTRCSCLMITPEWSDWRNNLVWWIQSVYVLPGYRKSGIFKMMYSFIKSLVAQRNDVAGIRLYVDNTNLNAREVYRIIGMTDEHYRLFEWMK